MQRPIIRMLSAFILIAILLTACGGEATTAPPQIEQPTEAPEATEAPDAPMEDEKTAESSSPSDSMVELPTVNPADVPGDVVSAGSSTVFPLAEVIAGLYEGEGGGRITIDSIGSGGGFERFCETGETDVSNASRGIKDSEVESCAAIGRTPIEFRVGTDAIAVAVSAENDFLTDVTMEELAAIFSTAETWADVRADWPAEPILRYIPGTDSGTFDYFVEEVFDKDPEPILNASNTQLSEDDNVLVQGVVGSPYAVAFYGYAYYVENADVTNVLSIDGIEATLETVDSFEYPLARPLFIYSDAAIMQEKPQVAAYINYFLTHVNEVIDEVGYFPANAEVLDNAKKSWLDAMGQDVAMPEAPAEEPEMEEKGGILPAVNPADVPGDVVSAGSSTVFPLAEVIAGLYEGEGGGNITIDSIGSGGGFERFCETGETDVSNASRGIKDSEVEFCAAIGRTPIEFRVGTDAIAVAVSAENDFVTDVTMAELAAIFSTAETWADVRADWPAEPILRYIPGTDSGTFDYFVEEVFDKDPEPILNASNTQLSEDDNVLVQGVVGSPYAVAFYGYAYYVENADVTNVLSIDSIEATLETVDSFEYPLARPLFIYSDAAIMQEKPQVAAYINYFLTHVNEVIDEVGYFPANDEVLLGAKSAWLSAMGMAVELPAVNPADVSGDVVSAGSSTVFPLAEVIAGMYEGEGGGNVTIDSIGSGGGFERFCETGETDVSNASRGIKSSEVESCAALGRTPIEFRVGTDAIAVAVSAENDFVTDVTMEELAAIFSTAETWSDVRPEWPTEAILRYIPGTDSGTFDYFVEEVFDKDPEPILNASNTQLSEDDNVLVQGVVGSPYAIAFYGYAYYVENADVTNVLSIDGIEATLETVDSFEYPLARPLFIYSDANIMMEKPQVAAYINYFLTHVNEVIDEVGYFPANAEVLNVAKLLWLNAMAE